MSYTHRWSNRDLTLSWSSERKVGIYVDFNEGGTSSFKL